MGSRQEIRAGVAAMALMFYGLLCGLNYQEQQLAHWRRVLGFWGICLVMGMFVVMVTLDRMIERAIMMGMLGVCIAATGVGVLVILVLMMLHLSSLMNRLDTFITRLPFMLTSSIVYGCTWYVPTILWQHPTYWTAMPMWLPPVLVGLGGVLLVLLIAGICRLFGFGFVTAILETFVWGWYCVFFLILMVSGSDADQDVG